MIADLATGRLGLTLAMPRSVKVDADRAHSAEIVSDDPEAKWWLFHWPGRRFDLSTDHWEHLRAHAEHHARHMFEIAFAQQDNPEATKPRTAGGSWSPLVDFERIEIDGAAALMSVHRMVQQPGREVMLGHLLVPLSSGLFEARVATADTLTGVRESALMLLQEQHGTIDPQRYDDEQYDEKFPEHCLSQARACLRWMRSKTIVRDGWAPSPRGEVELADVGCALVPPPRFVLGMQQDSRASFERVSFCGTDGVDQLLIEQDPKTQIPDADVEGWAEHTARLTHVEADVKDVQVATSSQELPDGRTDVLAIVEGTGNLGPLRNAMWWIRGPAGGSHCLSLIGSAAVPADVLAGELAATATSWRAVGQPRKPRFELS